MGTAVPGYQVPFTNAWFWNGWGDNNYSKFVKKNFSGNYPRIAYNKVNNNFQQSAYWLRDGGFFKIQNVELGFDAPIPAGSKTGIKGLRIFLRGANLLTISGSRMSIRNRSIRAFPCTLYSGPSLRVSISPFN